MGQRKVKQNCSLFESILFEILVVRECTEPFNEQSLLELLHFFQMQFSWSFSMILQHEQAPDVS